MAGRDGRGKKLIPVPHDKRTVVEITSCLGVMGSESSNGISAFFRRT